MKVFADEGIFGTQAKKRPKFLKMIRMCRQQKIDLIITKSISRFARNTVDCLEYVRQLKDLGIGVIFEKENLNTQTMTSEFMIALYGSFAQAESESISKNVSWGKQKAYAEGKVSFQYAKLLGYKKGANDKPEIVPEEAETVRMIYGLFLDGLSFTRIKKTLESRNLLTATGKKIWSESNIKSILKNEKYVGDALLQKTFTVDCITKKSRKIMVNVPCIWSQIIMIPSLTETHSIEFSKSLQGELPNVKSAIKPLRSKVSIPVNTHFPNCSFAVIAAHLIVDALGLRVEESRSYGGVSAVWNTAKNTVPILRPSMKHRFKGQF